MLLVLIGRSASERALNDCIWKLLDMYRDYLDCTELLVVVERRVQDLFRNNRGKCSRLVQNTSYPFHCYCYVHCCLIRYDSVTSCRYIQSQHTARCTMFNVSPAPVNPVTCRALLPNKATHPSFGIKKKKPMGRGFRVRIFSAGRNARVKGRLNDFCNCNSTLLYQISYISLIYLIWRNSGMLLWTKRKREI